jgi:CheY-like chemotaxis protein
MLALVVDDSRAKRSILTRSSPTWDFACTGTRYTGRPVDPGPRGDPGRRTDRLEHAVMDGLTLIKEIRRREELRNNHLMRWAPRRATQQIVRALGSRGPTNT